MLMRYWYSPLPVNKHQEAHLLAAGFTKFCEGSHALPDHTLILYAPPDAVLAAASQGLEALPNPQILIESYEHVQALCANHSVIAAWRLEALESHDVLPWLERQRPDPELGPSPAPDPLIALLMQGLLKSEPRLLKAYLDLELMAELAGGEPDTHYLQRMHKSAANPQQLLESWWQPFSQVNILLSEQECQSARIEILAANKQEACEQADLTLLQLHQLQEELEQAIHADRSKENQIALLQNESDSKAAKIHDLEKVISQLERECLTARHAKDFALKDLARLKQEKSAQSNLMQQLREEADLTLSQLHHAQEEVEHALRKATTTGQLAEAQHHQLQRVQGLMSRLLIHGSNPGQPLPTTGVEVLPPISTTELDTSLQSQALLRTYAYSLQRAAALLQRMSP